MTSNGRWETETVFVPWSAIPSIRSGKQRHFRVVAHMGPTRRVNRYEPKLYEPSYEPRDTT